jgi:hypothetical protein
MTYGNAFRTFLSARTYLIIFCFQRTKVHLACTPDVQFQRGRTYESPSTPMRTLFRVTVFLLFLCSPLVAQVSVFWQPGFPTVSNQPLDRATLSAALNDPHLAFLDLKALQIPGALAHTELLLLPYGSAVPTDAWDAIEAYLQHGGNLLVLGGQPLHVPVTQVDGTFAQGRPQDTYARVLDLRHTYEVHVPRDAHYAWKPGYTFDTIPKVQAEKFFTVEGHLNGLG